MNVCHDLTLTDSALCYKQIFCLMFRVSDFILLQLYFENADDPHNKQMQSDAAKAAPLI